MSLIEYKVKRVYFSTIILISAYLAKALSLPSIIANPTSMNVSLNGTASFTCSALNVVYIFWQVNYTSFDSIPDLDENYDYEINGDMSTSKLEIKLHPDLETNVLNNSVITCIGYGLLEEDIVWFTNSSTAARLLIQGRLNAPRNVSSVYNDSMFMVSWLPPFTMEGVHVKYLIEIMEEFENGTGTIVKEDVAENETTSIVHVDNSSCTLYTTCVTPMTEAGEGQPGCTNVSRETGTSQANPVQDFCQAKEIQ